MNPVLMKAILAMDSYNRGYASRINDNGPIDPDGLGVLGAKIGNAAVLNIALPANAQAVSFYALAYAYDSNGDGKTDEIIISYRGTDDIANDTLNGYGVGAGDPAAPQALMALQFYESVKNAGATNITLTGHSMGGGLAGLVGAIKQKSATLFDNMLFEEAANNAYTIASSSQSQFYIDPLSKKVYTALQYASMGSPVTYIVVDANEISQLKLYGYSNKPTPTLQFPSALITTHYMEGEILDISRILGGHTNQKTPQWAYSWGINHDFTTLGLDEHSMSSLAMSIYADTNVTQKNYLYAGQYFWPVLYNSAFASSIGVNLPGAYNAQNDQASILRTILAYSAIDEGTRVFGDTGIVALYNDANDLGTALADPYVSNAITTYATDISKIFVQFAGLLALSKTLQTSMPNAVNGVLSINAGNLVIDLSASLWRTANGGKIMPNMVAPQTFLGDVLIDTGIQAQITAKMIQYWGNGNVSTIGKIILPTQAASYIDASMDPGVSGATLIVRGNEGGSITGTAGRDIIVGGDGNDSINAGPSMWSYNAKNIIFGGNGSDSITGGNGDDYINPGNDASSDYISGGAAGSHDWDTLDISGFTTPTTLDLSNNTYFSGAAGGAFQNIENFILGSGDDTIILQGSYTQGLDHYIIDAGNGYNKLQVSTGFVTTNSIYRNGIEVIGIDEIQINSGGNFGEAGSLTILNIGHIFTTLNPIYAGNFNYSNYNSALTFNINPAGNSSVTDGVKTDLFKGIWNWQGIGTNKGDTINLASNRSYPLAYFITGTGNDIITTDGATIRYTGGNDKINYSFSSGSLNDGNLKVQFTVPSTQVSFKDTVYSTTTNNTTGIKTELIERVYTVLGQGTLAIKGFELQTNYGADQKFGTADDKVLLDERSFLTVTYNLPTYSSTTGDNVLTGSSLNGGLGNDTLTGTAGIDGLEGSFGNDILYGLAGDDYLYGGGGDDYLHGGSGIDTLEGGLGNDTLVAGDEFDRFIGGSGYDLLDFSATTSAREFHNSLGYWNYGMNSMWAGISGIEFIKATSYGDTLSYYYNGPAVEVVSIDGNGGNDLVKFYLSSANYTAAVQNELAVYKAGLSAGQSQIWLNLSELGLHIKSFENMQVYVNNALVTLPTVAANTAPVSSLISINAYANSPTIINVLSSVTDVATDVITVASITQAAHGSVVLNQDGTITYTPVLNYLGNDTFSYTVSDQYGATSTSSVSLVVKNNSNANPLAVTDNASTAEDTAKTINVLANDTDPNGDALSVSAVGPALHGTVTFTGASVTYVPAANYYGSDSFTYTLSDGRGGTATGIVNMTVSPVNDAPIAVNDTVATNMNTAVVINVKSNDTDVENNSLAITSISSPVRGTALINANGTVIYTPKPNTYGADSFTYTINDGQGGTSTATVNVSVAPGTIYGTTGNDTLYGDYANDTIYGGAGNDIIDGGAGNDILNGEAGTDTLVYNLVTSAITVNLGLTTAQNTGGAGSDTISNFENLTGSAYNDTLTGSSAANTILGGAGNDTIDGGAGNDILNGETGTDTLSYASATSAISVNLGLTTAQATGGSGTDTISNFENLKGSGYNDTLTGNSAANTIYAGNGNDTIRGSSGNDVLYGEAGNDILYGDAGNDTLTGGAGADRFVFTSMANGIDTISDFNKSQLDKIDIKSLLVGYDPVTKAITDFVQITTSGSDSILKIDTDGGANNFVQIATLKGITGLTDEAALIASGHLIAN